MSEPVGFKNRLLFQFKALPIIVLIWVLIELMVPSLYFWAGMIGIVLGTFFWPAFFYYVTDLPLMKAKQEREERLRQIFGDNV